MGGGAEEEFSVEEISLSVSVREGLASVPEEELEEAWFKTRFATPRGRELGKPL